MYISVDLGDKAVLRELGARLRGVRLERNLSQADLAEQAGLGRVTLQRIETGHPTALVNLIRLLRVLDLFATLDQLVPETAPSPIEELKRHGRSRQRAGSTRAPTDGGEEPQPWRWGDESEKSES